MNIVFACGLCVSCIIRYLLGIRLCWNSYVKELKKFVIWSKYLPLNIVTHVSFHILGGSTVLNFMHQFPCFFLFHLGITIVLEACFLLAAGFRKVGGGSQKIQEAQGLARSPYPLIAGLLAIYLWPVRPVITFPACQNVGKTSPTSLLTYFMSVHHLHGRQRLRTTNVLHPIIPQQRNVFLMRWKHV